MNPGFHLQADFLPPKIRGKVGTCEPRRRPLSDVSGALRNLGNLDLDAEHVRALCEQGILVAFNITAVSGVRRTLRVLTASIDYFQANAGKLYHNPAWPELLKLLIPHDRPVLTGLEIRYILLCDRGHVENLVKAGQLQAVKNSRPGPGGSWIITRESFEAFLKARKL